MPKGIPNKPKVEHAPDAAALVQRDRSGPPRNHQRSEGKDNFAAITIAAHESVKALETEA